MSKAVSSVIHPAGEPKRGPLAFYHRTPLFARILISLALGVVAGDLLGHRAQAFKPFSDIVLQLLRLLATPLIFIAVDPCAAERRTSAAARRAGWHFFLLTNTVVAICIGLLVANVIQPGHWAHLAPPGDRRRRQPFDPGAGPAR